MSHRRADPVATAKDDPSLPVVALVGRPNVGKSSLFNRLVGGRPAIVEDRPGITRDRRYGVCTWNGASFRVCDTGGLDPSAEGILGAMRGQTLRAVDEGVILVFVVDGREGLSAVDTDVAKVLRRTGKPVFLAVNKVDNNARESALGDVYALGFEQVFPISAAHGRGVGDMLDALVKALGDRVRRNPTQPKPDRRKRRNESEPEAAPEPAADAPTSDGPIRLTFLGKPNVGKSSLVNRLLGEERVLVHDQPGTTRDPIDTPFEFDGRAYVLVDTAGIRKRKVVKTITEAVSAKMARDQVARSHVVALVIDAAIGPSDDDARLANMVEETGRALVVVLNKGDLIPRAQMDLHMQALKSRLAFVSWAPFVITSAHTGRGVTDVVSAAEKAWTSWTTRVPTGDLNRHFQEWVTTRPPPSGPAGKHVRLYYVTQPEIAPPTFFVSSNMPAAVGYPYRRYLANKLRATYGFEGAPIKLAVRGHRKRKRGEAESEFELPPELEASVEEAGEP